jgi:hypothetical protein
MRNKITSILLLLLFGLVIAFPGYSKQAPKSMVTSICADVEEDFSLKNIFGKCLSSGINAIEEERSTEEDDASSAECDYISPADYYHLASIIFITRYHSTSELVFNEYVDIHCPPPNTFII